METALEVNIATDKDRMKPKMDNETLERIYNLYYKNVYNYICFRLNNHFDAEDLACVVFEKSIGGWVSYNPDFPIEAWLIGIAKNTVTDYFRAKGRRQTVGIESIFTLVSSGKQPDEVVVTKDENRALITAMAKLKDRERQILSMKFATDLKNGEIANLMGISPTNVGAIVHRALKKMKSFLVE